ncbi:MAG: TRAP transporter small permease subunit [Kiloniellales bacterium]|nr:TRAP transporter small permease subunit [Kiloniellales bacterium]
MNAFASLSRISDRLDRGVTVACVAIVLVMLSISTLGIVLEILFELAEYFDLATYFVASPLEWAYAHTRPSMTRLFLPWLAMLSITVAFKRGEHIAITMATRALPPLALRAVQCLNLTVVALFGIALVWHGFGFFLSSTQLFMVSELLQVSHQWTAASVPVAGLIMCVHLLSGVALVEHHDPALDELPEAEGAP